MIDKIKKALEALGVRGDFTVKPIDDARCAVYTDSEYFGVYDSMRETFVD